MNNLETQIDNLKTLQQSYDSLAAASDAYNEGKPALASAITAKGVATQPTDSLAQMAQNIGFIQQTPLENESVTGNAVFPQPYVWNLISEAYAHQRGEYPNMILAEFYKSSFTTIPLAGADAYYTCDGDFYEYATTHTWHDETLGRSNRYVIYYFHENNSNFNISNTSICPRRMTILGKIGNISLSDNGRIVNIFNCGEVNQLPFGTYTNPWGVDVCVMGVKEHSAGTLITLDNDHKYVSNILLGIKNITGGTLVSVTAAANLSSVNFPETEEVTGNAKLIGIEQNLNIESLGYIGVENIRRIDIIAGTNVIFCNNNVTTSVKTLNFASLEELIAPNSFACNFVRIDQLQTMYLPVLEYSSWGKTYMYQIQSSYLEYIYLGYKTNDKTKSVLLWMNCPNLTDIELKDGYCKPLEIETATALTEANMYAHILQRLKQDEADCGDGVTITLGATNLAKLTSAESVQLLDDLTNIYGYTFA